jgi:NADPH:quinone reductase-like Zn-dependent oxidoreductase
MLARKTVFARFAKWKGAHVIGTASENNQGLLRDLGVDEPVDYQKKPFEEIAVDVDVVLDTIGGETQERSLKALIKGGILLSIVRPLSKDLAAKYGVRAEFFAMKPSSPVLAEIAQLVDAGRIKTVVERVLALSEARQAHELSEKGHVRGKIVLKVV